MRLTINPACSSTFKCCEIAGWVISKGSASSFTVASPSANRARIARRVGSERAAKEASRPDIFDISRYLYKQLLIVKKNLRSSNWTTSRPEIFCQPKIALANPGKTLAGQGKSAIFTVCALRHVRELAVLANCNAAITVREVAFVGNCRIACTILRHAVVNAVHSIEN